MMIFADIRNAARAMLGWIEREPGLLDVATLILLVAVFCLASPPWNYAAMALLFALWLGPKLIRAVIGQDRDL